MSIINDSIAAVNAENNELHHAIAQLEKALGSILIGPVKVFDHPPIKGLALFEQELCHTKNSVSHAKQRIQDIILRLRV